MATTETLLDITLRPAGGNVSLRAQRFLFRLLLAATDVAALGSAFWLAYSVRFTLGFTFSPEIVPDPAFYPRLSAWLAVLFMATFVAFRLYDPDCLLGGVAEYSRICTACTVATIAVIVATFIWPLFIVSRVYVISAWVLSTLTVCAGRFLCRRVAYLLRARGFLLVPTVIVGSNREAFTLAEELLDWRSSGLRVLGFVATNGGPAGHGQTAPLPTLGPVSEIRRIIMEHGVEDLVVAITAMGREELLRLCEEVNSIKGVHLRLSSGLYEILTTGVTVRSLGGVPLVSLNKARLETHQILVKTVLEFSAALLGVLVLWPVLLALAMIVKIDSPGPVFHRRRVLGTSGRQFDALKFRTMRLDGDDLLKELPELETELRENHKLKNDPRVTRTGRWLRKFSLDELPQLLNVLFGQMSLVGPRMITPAEIDKYGRHKLNLLTVKPGITGLWQVSGRSDVSYDERVRMDMYYVRNYSIWLDLQILFVQTLPAIVKGRGAY
jgi:exopolysaccharide biosynthesis polyprenyl glycosylphosphotransferase